MKKIILVCVILLTLFYYPSTASYYNDTETILTPKGYIVHYAHAFGANPDELLKIAKCESGLRPNAINYDDGKKGSHSYGLFQYKKSTFSQFSKLLGEDLNIESYHDQAKLTARVFAEYPKYKKHWGCYKG